MTLRKSDLSKQKEELMTRRAEMLADISATTQDLLDDDQAFADSVDLASAESDKTMRLRIKDRGRDALVEVEQALRRIEAGSFGECESCGEEIGDARLRANPSTTLCIDCKAELELEQRRSMRA